MLEVKFYDTVDDSLLKFAVIISQSNGKWVFCKHKERDTYEAPGGHREVGEDILETAKRELQEETGAVKFDIEPLCVYSVTGKNSVNETGEESFGLLCFAEINEFSGKLESEIEKVELMDELPENWTYPLIQPKLIEEWKRRQPWNDIAQSKEWKKIHKITKGWSADLKYKTHTKKGEVLLLRIADIDKYDEKKKEFDIITKYSKLGIPMSMPVEFGICNQNRNVYMILTWVEGQDLETVLQRLSENEQYLLGRQAGDILRKIHSIPVEEKDIPVWKCLIFILIGGILVVKGSDFAVSGASAIARYFGMSERFIGLTIVAFGTSLPELVTSVTAARKGNAGIAIGNIVGSNIFNILFVIGTAALICSVPFERKFIIDTIIAVLSGVLLWGGTIKKEELRKPCGILMLLGYAAYFVYLCVI